MWGSLWVLTLINLKYLKICKNEFDFAEISSVQLIYAIISELKGTNISGKIGNGLEKSVN